MGWLQDELTEFLDNLWYDVSTWFSDLAASLLEPAMKLMLGTPAPQTPDWVFGAPTNTPWDVWYSDVYLQFIIPITFAMWFLVTAYIGMISPRIAGHRRKKVLRRLGIAFGGMFLWFYFAAAGLQFFNALSLAIAPTPTEMTATFGDMIRGSVSGVILLIVVRAIENTLLLLALVVYAIRWVMLYVLTMAMPLLLVFWALEIGPLKRFSGLAQSLMGYFPGLLAATLPAAIMMRMAYETDLNFGLNGLTGLFVSLMFIPTATVLTVLVIMRSRKTVRKAAETTTNVAAPAAGYSRTVSVRGAQDVHRGLRGNSPVGSSSSHAYNVGQTVASRVPTGSAAGAAQSVASTASSARSTVQSTYSKIKRW